MTTLPIQKITLYKHGVGYFERRGHVQGETLRLSFPRQAMDDVLKSLIALDMGNGHILGLDFETPETRDELLAKGSIHLSDNHTLLDLLRDLRGRQVRCTIDDYLDNVIEGLVIGVEYNDKDALQNAVVSLYQTDKRAIRTIKLTIIDSLELLDESAASDLSYFLRAAQSEEDRRSATLHLSPGEHDILVGYIAPAPSWRVSYRLLFEHNDDTCSVLLQGWGLFDNQLEEDLDNVSLSLVAGMPVSFRYRLYEPQTPERPMVEDEERTVKAPVFFEGAPPPAPTSMSRAHLAEFAEAAEFGKELSMEEELSAADETYSFDDLEGSIEAMASGSERGALFAYTVSHPVSVARGQSAMVPILSQRLDCRRDLLYNRRKLPSHPVASLRLTNETGLTLERGPVTVIEDGTYAGEAVIPFTRTNNEVIVPYAVELGMTITEEHSRERRIISISVKDEYVLIQEYDIQHTTYHLSSTLSHAVDVVLEHEPRTDYHLTDTREPDEQGSRFMRWAISCAANTQTTFAVHEQRMLHRHEQIRRLSSENIQSYLANKLLDEPTSAQLEELLKIYYRIENAKQRINAITGERNAVYQHQRHIQGTMGPLNTSGEEGALRKRYVAELSALEDQLAALTKEEKQLKEQIASLEQDIRSKREALQQ